MEIKMVHRQKNNSTLNNSFIISNKAAS